MSSIKYLNVAEVDRMAQSARAADQAAQMNQFRMQDYMRQRDQQQTQDTLYRAAGGDAQMAAELAADEPGASMMTIKDFQDQAQQDKSRRLQAADQDVEIGKKLASLAADVYDQQSYDRYRSAATEYGKARGQAVNLPETYDDKAFQKIRDHAQQFETYTVTGKWGTEHRIQRNKRTGQETQTYTEAPPKTKDVTTWGMIAPADAKALGLPDGGSYQRSNHGQVQAVTKPAVPKGGDRGGDLAEAQALVDNGLAPDLATGFRMAKAAKNDPIKAGQLAAKTVFDAQQKAIEANELDPDSPEVKTYDELLDTYTHHFQRVYDRAMGGKMSGVGTRESPYTPQNDSDYENIPAGQVFIDPDDGKPYVK